MAETLVKSRGGLRKIGKGGGEGGVGEGEREKSITSEKAKHLRRAGNKAEEGGSRLK